MIFSRSFTYCCFFCCTTDLPDIYRSNLFFFLFFAAFYMQDLFSSWVIKTVCLLNVFSLFWKRGWLVCLKWKVNDTGCECVKFCIFFHREITTESGSITFLQLILVPMSLLYMVDYMIQITKMEISGASYVLFSITTMYKQNSTLVSAMFLWQQPRWPVTAQLHPSGYFVISKKFL